MKILMLQLLKTSLVFWVMLPTLMGLAQTQNQSPVPHAGVVAESPATEVPDNQKININQAGEEELVRLPRIGPVIAKRIIAFREEHGGFKKLTELMNVRGIGEKTFQGLLPLIRL